MKQFSKAEQTVLGELFTLAYERELGHLLTELEEEFSRWQADVIDSIQLSICIHEFDRGPAEELFELYEGLDPDVIVARALSQGLLQDDEVPEQIRKRLASHIVFYDRQLG